MNRKGYKDYHMKNNKTGEPLRLCLTAAIAVMCMVTAFLGYGFQFDHWGEYCFISNMSVGILFLTSVIFRVSKGAFLSDVFYFDGMIVLLLIFVATLSIGLNLEGAFWFLHIINPVIVILYWFFFCRHKRNVSGKNVLTALIFPLAYYAFTMILFALTGQCPFPISIVTDLGGIYPFIFPLIMTPVLLGLGYGLHFLNRRIHSGTE